MRRPAIRVELRAGAPVDPAGWPDSVPAIAHLVRHGLEIPAGVTFLVGENGARKSTIVEAVAEAMGIPPDGGSSDHLAGAPRDVGDDRSGLGARLHVVREAGAGQGPGFFLRAETMHRFVTYLAQAGSLPEAHPLHQVSHGESFVEMLTSSWVSRAGVVLLDEPESALSFTNELALLDVLAHLADTGKHILCATHSPVLIALPGAQILQLNDAGISREDWSDLDLVGHWRSFLQAPGRYLQHLDG